MTLIQRLDKFPPYLCRLVARTGHGHRRKTIRQIAKDSGLSKSLVAEIAVRTSWKDCTLNQVQRFSLGCGVDLFHTKDHRRYLRERKLAGIMRDKRSRRYSKRLFSLAVGS